MINYKQWSALAVAGCGLAFALAGCGSNGAGGGGSAAATADTVATVSGRTITREELHSQLEATHGDDALRQMIQYHSLMAYLDSKNIKIDDAEVQAAMDERAKREPAAKRIVDTGGAPKAALERQAREGYESAPD